MGDPKSVRLAESIEEEAEFLKQAEGLTTFTAVVNYCIHQTYIQRIKKSKRA
jgi:hypothetical protein